MERGGTKEEDEKGGEEGVVEGGFMYCGRRPRESEHDQGRLSSGCSEEAINVSQKDLRKREPCMFWAKLRRQLCRKHEDEQEGGIETEWKRVLFAGRQVQGRGKHFRGG